MTYTKRISILFILLFWTFSPFVAYSQVMCAHVFAGAPVSISLEQAAQSILEATKAYQGSTFNQGRLLGKEDYYVVSIFPELEVQTRQLSLLTIARYLKDNKALLDSDKSLAVGTWYDQKSQSVFLDVVKLVDARLPNAQRITEDLARRYQQLAYFDLKKSEEIRLDNP